MGWCGDRAAEAKERYSKPGAFETIMADLAVLASVAAVVIVAAFIGHQLLFHIKPDASQAIAGWVQAIGVPATIWIALMHEKARRAAEHARTVEQVTERVALDNRRAREAELASLQLLHRQLVEHHTLVAAVTKYVALSSSALGMSHLDSTKKAAAFSLASSDIKDFSAADLTGLPSGVSEHAREVRYMLNALQFQVETAKDLTWADGSAAQGMQKAVRMAARAIKALVSHAHKVEKELVNIEEKSGYATDSETHKVKPVAEWDFLSEADKQPEAASEKETRPKE